MNGQPFEQGIAVSWIVTTLWASEQQVYTWRQGAWLRFEDESGRRSSAGGEGVELF